MDRVLGLVFVCLLCSCDAHENAQPTRIVRISEFENMCAQAPGVLLRSTDAGPDFDIGVLTTYFGDEIDYYVGNKGIQLRDLKLISTKTRKISPEGIIWNDEKYTSNTKAVALTGYSNKLGGASLTVRYWFSASSKRERELVNALAASTKECAGVPSK